MPSHPRSRKPIRSSPPGSTGCNRCMRCSSGDVRNILFLLFGIVALVPLLACANVASLSLARATSRNTELATRLALGAARGRVLRQLLVESLLLALLGGALGLALTLGGGALLRSLGPATLPRLEEIGIDGPVLVFALLASLLTVPLFGVLPALRGTDFDLARALRFGGRGGGEGKSRSALIVGGVPGGPLHDPPHRFGPSVPEFPEPSVRGPRVPRREPAHRRDPTSGLQI